VHCDLNTQTNKSSNLLKLFIADARLPKTGWKVVPQPWVGSCETSFPSVAVDLQLNKNYSQTRPDYIDLKELHSSLLEFFVSCFFVWRSNWCLDCFSLEHPIINLCQYLQSVRYI